MYAISYAPDPVIKLPRDMRDYVSGLTNSDNRYRLARIAFCFKALLPYNCTRMGLLYQRERYLPEHLWPM